MDLAALTRWTPDAAIGTLQSVPRARPPAPEPPTTHYPTFLSLLLLLAAATPARAQAPSGTIVIVTGEQATVPIPTFMEGPGNTRANQDLADQLYLRLAVRKPGRATSDERGFEPQLARSWTRLDSLTLAFDLDQRARWHDGTPVTARDVVFTFRRAMSDSIAPSLASHLPYLASVTASGEHQVIVRFSRAYPEQLFDATYYVQPIPAHIFENRQPPSSAGAVAATPVGDGPYRWVRSVPGEFIELAAVPDFFLGRPGIGRVVFRTATDPSARLNLLLSGEADALSAIVPPLANRDRLLASGDFRVLTMASNLVGYLLYNLRTPGDSAAPHPVLADRRVRQALTLALDRQAMARSVFGGYGKVPYGPVSQVMWLSAVAPRPSRQDLATARRLLAQAGWRDRDGDGVLERNGTPLRLSVIVPSTSTMRRQLAIAAQEQLRQVGVQLDVLVLERPVWQERFVSGRFDIAFGSMTQSPTPSGLNESWTCAGSSNVSHYCDTVADSLLAAATLSVADPAATYVTLLRRIESDAPATFLFAPLDVVAVHKRFDGVELRDGSPWLMLWRWHVRRGQELPRDRVPR